MSARAAEGVYVCVVHSTPTSSTGAEIRCSRSRTRGVMYALCAEIGTAQSNVRTGDSNRNPKSFKQAFYSLVVLAVRASYANKISTLAGHAEIYQELSPEARGSNIIGFLNRKGF